MRSLQFALTAGLMLALAGSAAAQGPTKIGYINSQAILAQTPGATEAQDQFERDMARYRTEVDQMGQELQELISQFEQQQLTLSPQAKDTQTQAIQTKQQEYNTRVQELEEEAGRRQAELVQPIMDRVTAAIDQIREEGNYTVIFDLASESIVSADPAGDITDIVIQRLVQMASTGS